LPGQKAVKLTSKQNLEQIYNSKAIKVIGKGKLESYKTRNKANYMGHFTDNAIRPENKKAAYNPLRTAQDHSSTGSTGNGSSSTLQRRCSSQL